MSVQRKGRNDLQVVHMMIEAYGCRGDLNAPEPLVAWMQRAARAAGVKQVGRRLVRFVPHGLTGVLVLAQSHMLVATWPQYRMAMIDILLCGEGMDPALAWRALKGEMMPRRSVIRRVIRRVHRLRRE